MNFASTEMTASFASRIAGWQYPSPYDIYNMDGTDADVSEVMGGTYRAVMSDDELVGFYCTGQAAQVPGETDVLPYRESAVDFGIGMRPDLTGRGMGASFFGFVLSELRTHFPNEDIRLTVAVFNRRAIHLYEKFGFSSEYVFRNPMGREFQIMRFEQAPA